MTMGRPVGAASPPKSSTLRLDHADPSNGCFNGCGEARPQFLRYYQLVWNGKVWGHWRLCAECLVWGNPIDPRDTDPLRPEEAA